MIVDPAQRKAVYLVIRRNGLVRTERRILPLADIQVEAAGRVPRVDRDPAALEEFEEHRYPVSAEAREISHQLFSPP